MASLRLQGLVPPPPPFCIAQCQESMQESQSFPTSDPETITSTQQKPTETIVTISKLTSEAEITTAKMTSEDITTQMTSLSMGEALRMCEKTTTIEVIIALTHHPAPRVRKRALVEMCPCRVKDDLSDFWERVFEMVTDDDADVRYQVMHTLCDGSPNHLELRVAEALDTFNRDADPKIRRKAHQCLTSYWRKGKWNIM